MVDQPALQIVDPATGIPIQPVPNDNTPATSDPTQAAQPSFLDTYRTNHPEAANASDYTLARQLYDSGIHMDKEPYAQFATRIGVSQPPLATLANTGLSSAAFHLDEPIESTLAGLGNLLGNGSFGEGYRTKQQELSDQHEVGAYQNPTSNLTGNAAGTVADYIRFGPLLRKLADAVPGLASLVRTGPVADAAVKFAGLGEADQIPKTIQSQIERTDNPSVGTRIGDAATDLGATGAEGAGAAVLGAGASRLLSGVVSPLLSSVGRGMVAADDIAKGMPRSSATQAAGRLSSMFTGSADSPAKAALTEDKLHYGDLLDRGNINVPKALDQLSGLIQQPGYGMPIMRMAAEAGQDDPVMQELLHGYESGEKTPADVEAGLRNYVNSSMESDPTGSWARRFLSNIYQQLIPLRLSGPVDPEAGFDRNMITGRLSDRGKLIEPPFTGPDWLGNQLYERTGGGAGAVMRNLWSQAPLAALGGGARVAAQGASIPLRMAGYGLKGAGSATGALAEPGSAALWARPYDPNPLEGWPSAWQAGAFPAFTGQNRGDAGTSYTPPSPGPQDHSSLDFPDVYAPQHADAEPLDQSKVHTLLQVAPPQQVAAYVSQKLSPQIGAELQSADKQSYGAALFNLMSDPTSRRRLLS